MHLNVDLWQCSGDGQTKRQLDCTVVNFVNHCSLGNRHHSSFCILKFDQSGGTDCWERRLQLQQQIVPHFLCILYRFPVKCQRWISIQSTQFPLSLTFMDLHKSLGWETCVYRLSLAVSLQCHSSFGALSISWAHLLPLPSGLISGMFITLESSFKDFTSSSWSCVEDEHIMGRNYRRVSSINYSIKLRHSCEAESNCYTDT